MAESHIVAIGGGQPSDLLTSEVFGLTGKDRPRVCFLPTAAGDDARDIVEFYGAFARRTEASHLQLFGRTVDDLRTFLLEQDAIYVGGGNTRNMLAVWRAQGVDEVLHEAWQRGIVLWGCSAGAICWFESGVTGTSRSGPLAPLREGLGFLPGSACAHYDSDEQRRPTFHRLVREGLPAGIGLDDAVGVHFVETELVEVLTGVEGDRAYRVELRDGEVVETPLEARLLS